MYDDNLDISCDNITNHWLYFIFSGYLLPLISPKMRRYLNEVYNSLKNNEITGKVVTLPEFGFDKIQDIQHISMSSESPFVNQNFTTASGQTSNTITKMKNPIKITPKKR